MTTYLDKPARVYRVAKIINFFSWGITGVPIEGRSYCASVEFQISAAATKHWDEVQMKGRVWDSLVIIQAPKASPRKPWQIILGRPYCEGTQWTGRTDPRCKSGWWHSTGLRFTCTEIIQTFKQELL